ncbi:hypothetical protein [Methylobacterium tarhaniae]|uniref:hypothetical protein n=1 Tax=Methylobacterium tarhaniae TaxID=1187852 RepID=UPI0012EE3718|nr:hypothetical protein [Methylobacterium tarhaniae]
MILYHYTAQRNLAGIAKYGLTIGDVPTDIRRSKGRVGVWLTTSPESTGHGLGGEGRSTIRYRLTIDVPEATVVRWSEWAPGRVTQETIDNLKRCAGRDGASQWETWFICFIIVRTSSIVACRDLIEGVDIDDWINCSPVGSAFFSVPPWRREEWHRELLKGNSRHLRDIERSGMRIVI